MCTAAARLARSLTALALLVALVASAAPARARSSHRRQVTRSLRSRARTKQYQRFVSKLKRADSSATKRALGELDKLAQGGGHAVSEWVERDLVKAGFSASEFRQAVKHAEHLGSKARLPKLLERFMRGGSSYGEGPRTKGEKQLLGALEGMMLWRSAGRSKMARKAKQRALAIAKGLGVDIKAALAADVGYRLEVRRYNGPGDKNVHDRDSKEIPFVQLRRGRKADKLELPADVTRQVPRNPLWWTGNQSAYVDLLMRRMPQLIVERIKQNPDAPVFRIWHAGHEDASQTFVLAAMADRAIAQLSKQRPDLAKSLAKIKVEIYATDLGHKVLRNGREVSFAIDRDAPEADKTPLHLALFGKGQSAKAKREIAQLEQGFFKLGDRARVQRLRKLADAGKMAQLVGDLLAPTPLMAGSVHGKYTNTFRIKSKRWRVVDRENGGVLNREASGRVIHFSLGDLTKSKPAQNIDLAVCSNVLPWLGLYEGRFNGGWDNRESRNRALNSAVKNLVGSLRQGGALLMDVKSEHAIARDAADATKQAAKGKKLWVTRSKTIERIDYDNKSGW